jgi:hypothetical protein
MTLTYRITLEDFMNAQRLHRAKGLPLWRRTTHFLLPGLLLTVLCFGIIGWVISKDPRFAANFQPLLILCTIWLGHFGCCLSIRGEERTRKIEGFKRK